MKIVLELKDPDGVYYALNQRNISEQDKEVIRKFVSYSEYVSIEIDTETETARVLKVGEER